MEEGWERGGGGKRVGGEEGRGRGGRGGCECVLKLLGWNLTDCDGVYGQYTVMCSVDSVRCVDG